MKQRKKETIKFSVIVPIYGVQDFIHKCVDSIIGQTYKNIEIILVDDGSPDECGRICDKYAKLDKRIKVIHKRNGGLISARKAGDAIAKGDYIICVDGDDWIEKEYIEAMACVINEVKPDMVCCGFIFDYPNKSMNHPIKFGQGLYNKKAMEENIYASLIQTEDATYFPPHVFAKVIKREIYHKAQQSVNEDFSIGEDAACIIPCIYNAQSMYILDKCLYHYRMNRWSLTNDKKPFSWNGPKSIYDTISSQINLKEYHFQEQLDRKYVHELFLVIKSQFYRKEPYYKIKQDIDKKLDDSFTKSVIKRCHFSCLKGKVMVMSLKKRMYHLILLYSRMK